MRDALASPDKTRPLLLAPDALRAQWARRVPASHLAMAGHAGHALKRNSVSAAQLGAFDALFFAPGAAASVHAEETGAIVARADAKTARAAIAEATAWKETGASFESAGGTYALFFAPGEWLELALAEGRYDVTSASVKLGAKKITLVRLARVGPRRPTTIDLESPPALSDADFGVAEALAWAEVSDGETAIGDAFVMKGGYASAWWPIRDGALVFAAERGDGPDSVAAALAIPRDRFVDTGKTVVIGADGSVGLASKLAPGTYRIAVARKFETRAALLASVVRLTKA